MRGHTGGLSCWVRVGVVVLAMMTGERWSGCLGGEVGEGEAGVGHHAGDGVPDGTGQADEADPASLSIKGLGWLGNLQMKAVLRQVRGSSEPPVVYDANAIEDGAFLLLHHAQGLGYLDAAVRLELTLENGEELTEVWQGRDLVPLPRPLAATEVRYRVTPGLRYFYRSILFRGLTVLSEEEASRYFVRSDGLLKTRALRRFSRNEFTDASRALETALQTMGYARARVVPEDPEIDPESGAVRVVVGVEEGPLHRVSGVRVTVRDAADGPVVVEETREYEGVLSRAGLEDLEQEVLQAWFREGYPDATARLTTEGQTADETGMVQVKVRAEVVRGPRVPLGTVRFTGRGAPEPGRIRKPLARRSALEGPWLDRLAVDEARSRIARLGGYRFIRVDYEASATDSEVRDPVFDLEPGRRLSVDLLGGFRSYELLYAGVDVARRNLFGLGHSVDLRLIQSFKASEGTATYSIPDVLVDDLTVFGLVDFLSRQEVSFRREESRAGAGMRRVFEGTGHQVGVRYTFELLRALDAPSEATRFSGANQPLVSSVTLDWQLDHRDSAVSPRAGYDLGVTLEVAVPELGGEARYLRPEIRGSAHLPLRGGRYLRAGLRYSLVSDPGDEGLVPFNKRFLPGGDDSVRGYQRGEASPRNAAGEIIGAEAALVWNFEFEQLLTPSWSVVGFVDGVGQTARLRERMWDETLWSAGVGLRWNSVIGPIRVEYGHNLNPRPADPAGTVHVSIGFPF
ncbi:MAG: BamA/TamA family outer membrane protein [Verrucomicrobiae bacterium]|nr:BamA/TamA family outer membrane protein [Verrucomicrobiae bacterium]